MSRLVSKIARLALVVASYVIPGTAASQPPPKLVEVAPVPEPAEGVKNLVVYVNLNERAELLIPDKAPVKEWNAITKHIRGELAVESAKVNGKNARVIVILRAPAETQYGAVITLRDFCTREGVDVYLRVRQSNPDK